MNTSLDTTSSESGSSHNKVVANLVSNFGDPLYNSKPSIFYIWKLYIMMQSSKSWVFFIT